MNYKEQTQKRSDKGKKAGAVGIFVNILLAVAKLMVGFISGSVSIIADALNNLMDGASSIVTLVGFKLAEKPADEEHPFGHARSEYLAGLVVSMMIFVVGYELVISEEFGFMGILIVSTLFLIIIYRGLELVGIVKIGLVSIWRLG